MTYLYTPTVARGWTIVGGWLWVPAGPIVAQVHRGAFDGMLSAQFTSPPLSTVHMPIGEIGGATIGRLADHLQHPSAWKPEQQHFPSKLVLRQSTAASRDTAQTKAS